MALYNHTQGKPLITKAQMTQILFFLFFFLPPPPPTSFPSPIGFWIPSFSLRVKYLTYLRQELEAALKEREATHGVLEEW